MRIIAIEQFVPDMVLAKPVYDNRGRVLLAEGKTVHPKVIERLWSMGISSLIVEDELSKGIGLEELVEMPTWMQMVQFIEKCYQQAKGRNQLVPKEVLEAANQLVNECLSHPILLPVSPKAVAEEIQPYACSVNITIWSLQVGKKLGYNALQLRDLAVGCLLHNIGKTLTTEDKLHPEMGFSLIKNYREFSLISAHIAFQHHECWDGSGFPRGIHGDSFLEMAQICAISSLYEELLLDGKLMRYEIMELLMTLAGTRFSTSIVQVFNQAVPLYTPGMKATTNDGKDVMVTRLTNNLQRPYIRYNDTREEIDLSEHPTVLLKDS